MSEELLPTELIGRTVTIILRSPQGDVVDLAGAELLRQQHGWVTLRHRGRIAWCRIADLLRVIEPDREPAQGVVS